MLKHIQSTPTLPLWLATRGYRSLQTGKWWEGHPRLGGFTDAMTHGDPNRGGRHGDLGLIELASWNPKIPAPRQTVFGEIIDHDVVDIDRPSVSLRHRWVRHGFMKLIAPTGSAGPQLFDLSTDPHEMRDLASKTPGEVKRLKTLLDTWWQPRQAPPRPSGP